MKERERGKEKEEERVKGGGEGRVGTSGNNESFQASYFLVMV